MMRLKAYIYENPRDKVSLCRDGIMYPNMLVEDRVLVLKSLDNIITTTILDNIILIVSLILMKVDMSALVCIRLWMGYLIKSQP